MDEWKIMFDGYEMKVVMLGGGSVTANQTKGSVKSKLWPLGTIWTVDLVARFGGMLIWMAMMLQ